MISSSPLSALQRANKKKIIIPYRFLPVVIIGVIAILTSSIFNMLPPPILSNQPSAFATFPGENGKIAFSSNHEIYLMNADGSELTRLTNSQTDDDSPSWSPDGTKIAFGADRDSGDGSPEIYVMNADGSEPIRLTNYPPPDLFPDWSPDGTKIAFGSAREGDEFEDIYVMNADGSELTRLTNDPARDSRPSWSPDGEKIAFHSDRDIGNGYSEIYVMNADGSNPVRLTNNEDVDQDPDWSPDGTKIAFTSFRNNNGDIYVMNADGSEQTRLTNNLATDFTPSWSPDGTKIAFTSERDVVVVFGTINPNDEIYVMNADGSEQTRLTRNPAVDVSPDWGPAADTEPEDTTPPVITVPDDITEEATSADGAEVSFEVFAEDDVDGAVDVSCDYDSGDTFPIGETVVTCSAEDAAGNRAEESFTITVQDTTAPTLQLPSSSDVTAEATSADGAAVSYTARATDTVDGGSVPVTCTPDSGSTFPLGQTTVNCEAQDAAGNRATGSFIVTVQDTTDPDVEITEAVDRRRNTEIPDGGTPPIPYVQITFEATDAVGIDETECSLDGQAFTPCTSPVSYDRLSRGTHEVTIRATDAAGNTGEDQFTWTVGNPSSAAATAPGRQ